MIVSAISLCCDPLSAALGLTRPNAHLMVVDVTAHYASTTAAIDRVRTTHDPGQRTREMRQQLTRSLSRMKFAKK